MKINRFAIINDKNGEIKGKVLNFNSGLNIIKSDSTHGKSFIFALIGSTLGSYKMANVAQKEILEGRDGIVKTILDLSWGNNHYLIKMTMSAEEKNYNINGENITINQLVDKLYSENLLFPLVNFWSKAASTVEPGDFLASIMDTQSTAQSMNIYDGIVGDSAVKTRYIFGINAWRDEFKEKAIEINNHIDLLKEAVDSEIINDFTKLQRSMKKYSSWNDPSERVVKLMEKRTNLSKRMFFLKKTISYKKQLNIGLIDSEIIGYINSYNKTEFSEGEVKTFNKIFNSILVEKIINNEDTTKLESEVLKVSTRIKKIDDQLKTMNTNDTYMLELLSNIKTNETDPKSLEEVKKIREMIGELYATTKNGLHKFINENAHSYYSELKNLKVNLGYETNLINKYQTIGYSGVKKVTSNLVSRFLIFEYINQKNNPLFIVDSLLETSASVNIDTDIKSLSKDTKQKYSNIFLKKTLKLGEQFIIFLDTESVGVGWENYVIDDLTLLATEKDKVDKILDQAIQNDIDEIWVASILSSW